MASRGRDGYICSPALTAGASVQSSAGQSTCQSTCRKQAQALVTSARQPQMGASLPHMSAAPLRDQLIHDEPSQAPPTDPTPCMMLPLDTFALTPPTTHTAEQRRCRPHVLSEWSWHNITHGLHCHRSTMHVACMCVSIHPPYRQHHNSPCPSPPEAHRQPPCHIPQLLQCLVRNFIVTPQVQLLQGAAGGKAGSSGCIQAGVQAVAGQRA